MVKVENTYNVTETNDTIRRKFETFENKYKNR